MLEVANHSARSRQNPIVEYDTYGKEKSKSANQGKLTP